jgi:uncharacterized membrane protein YdbT with pleckstrin-like domain
MPISFTTYSLSDDRLFVETGFLNRKYEEILLYRVRDISLARNLGQMIFGVGTIKIISSDMSAGELQIVNVRASKQVKELLHQLVEEAKIRRGFRFGEYEGAHNCHSDLSEGT